MSSAGQRAGRVLRRGFALTLAANVGNIALNMATGVLAARVLGAGGRGMLAAIQTVPSMVATLSLLGLPAAVSYYSAREPSASREVLTTGLVSALLFSCVGVAAGWIAVGLVFSDQPEVRTAASWYLAFVPLQALQYPAVTVAWGLGRFGTWNVLRLLAPLGWFGVLLWCAERGVSSAATAARLYLYVYAASVPVALVLARRASKGRSRVGLGRAAALVRYGAPSTLASVPSMLNLKLDQVLMAAWLPSKSLGLYAVAVSWSAALGPILAAAGTTVFPALAAGTHAERQEYVGTTMRLGVAASIVGSAALAATTPVFLPLLAGSEFAEAIPGAVILVFAAGVSALNTLAEECLRGVGRPRWTFYGQMAGLPVTAVLLSVLLRRGGLIAAAWVSLISYAATAAVLAWGLSTETDIKIRNLIVPRCSEMLGAWNAIKARISGSRRSEVQPE
jgi:O-antigen/teichoic acid export membrane protein